MVRSVTQINGVDLEEFKSIIRQVFVEELKEVKPQIKEVSLSAIKELLTRKETAEYLGLSLTTLHNLKVNGSLIPRKIGRKSYYHRDDILGLIDSRK